jgi:hypothetical protein
MRGDTKSRLALAQQADNDHPNPIRIVGFAFLVVGLITFALGLVRAS